MPRFGGNLFVCRASHAIKKSHPYGGLAQFCPISPLKQQKNTSQQAEFRHRWMVHNPPAVPPPSSGKQTTRRRPVRKRGGKWPQKAQNAPQTAPKRPKMAPKRRKMAQNDGETPREGCKTHRDPLYERTSGVSRPLRAVFRVLRAFSSIFCPGTIWV